MDFSPYQLKNFPDDCMLVSLRYGDICARKKFDSVLILQSLSFSPLRITRKHISGVSVSITKVAKDNSSSGVVFEEGIFENNSSLKKSEASEETYNETGSDTENNGLIPDEWKFLQQELYKTKAEKKRELHLQEMENARRKEMKAQFLRQKIEAGPWLDNGDVVLSGQASVTVSKDVLVKESQQLDENEQLGFEGCEATVESPESLVDAEALDPDFHSHTVWKESFKDAANNQAGKTQTQHKGQKSRVAQRIPAGDRELDLLFTNEEIMCLQRRIPDFSKTYSKKWPPLHVLTASGQFFFLEQFVKLDIDMNEVDEDGYTAIQRAVLGRKETAVSQLLRAGADVHICDKDNASLLHYAVQTGSLNLVRLLIKRGVDVNGSDEYGWTPLHVAVLTGRDDIVRHLLVSGADKSLKNKDGLTPLDICLALGGNINSHAVAKALKKLPKEELFTEIS